jgi:hypothetical protein
MKGTIRTILGLTITLFGVGALEHSVANSDLLLYFAVSMIGIVIFASGAYALSNEAQK